MGNSSHFFYGERILQSMHAINANRCYNRAAKKDSEAAR